MNIQFTAGLYLFCYFCLFVLFSEVMYKSQNNGDPRDAITRALIGTVVMTRYNNKTYKIDDILWDKSPLDTFPQSRGGGEISFIQYYQ